MENLSGLNEDTTFNALKYKRHASGDIKVGNIRIQAGATYWVNDAGLLHREDGPALEYSNGTKHWFQDGLKHREDGPATEWSGGEKYWYRNGKLIS